MKTKLKNVIKNNFIYIIMIIAIIAGGVVVSLKGFEYSIENMDHQRLEIILDTQYNEEEMDDIINQATNDRYILRTSSLFKTIVTMTQMITATMQIEIKSIADIFFIFFILLFVIILHLHNFITDMKL